MVAKYLCDRLDWPLEPSERKGKGKVKEEEVATKNMEVAAAPGPPPIPGPRHEAGTFGERGSVSPGTTSTVQDMGRKTDAGRKSAPSSSAVAPPSSSCAPASSPPDDLNHWQCCELSDRVFKVTTSRSDYSISRPAGGLKGSIPGPLRGTDATAVRAAKVKKGPKAQKIAHQVADDGATSRRVEAFPPSPLTCEEATGGQLRRPRRNGHVTAPAAVAISASSSSSRRASTAKKATHSPNSSAERKRGRSAVRSTTMSPVSPAAPSRVHSAGRFTRTSVATSSSKSNINVAGRMKAGRPPDRSESRSRSPAIQTAPPAHDDVTIPEKRKRGRPRKICT